MLVLSLKKSDNTKMYSTAHSSMLHSILSTLATVKNLRYHKIEIFIGLYVLVYCPIQQLFALTLSLMKGYTSKQWSLSGNGDKICDL